MNPAQKFQLLSPKVHPRTEDMTHEPELEFVLKLNTNINLEAGLPAHRYRTTAHASILREPLDKPMSREMLARHIMKSVRLCWTNSHARNSPPQHSQHVTRAYLCTAPQLLVSMSQKPQGKTLLECNTSTPGSAMQATRACE